MIEVVVFDVGETLIDETRIWERWADRLGVTRLTMAGLLGAMAGMDRSHREVFEIIRPGFELAAELAAWEIDDPRGLRENFDETDLYPDVPSVLAKLRGLGMRTLIAGNQPPQAGEALMRMGLEIDGVITSAELGAEKPSTEFFMHLVRWAGQTPDHLLYVGDRLDNDVLPARSVGMKTVLVRRGPWGYLHAARVEAALADLVATSLDEIPAFFLRPPQT
ncbi:MAG: HAD family hydrolase [Actinomycetota bacterium]